MKVQCTNIALPRVATDVIRCKRGLKSASFLPMTGASRIYIDGWTLFGVCTLSSRSEWNHLAGQIIGIIHWVVSTEERLHWFSFMTSLWQIIFSSLVSRENPKPLCSLLLFCVILWVWHYTLLLWSMRRCRHCWLQAVERKQPILSDN